MAAAAGQGAGSVRAAGRDDLLAALAGSGAASPSIELAAAELVRGQRAALQGRWVDGLLQQYGIGSAGGVALLMLAEAYLRVPDAATASALIAEKLAEGDWGAWRGGAGAWRGHAVARALMLAHSLTRRAPRSARLLRPGVGLALRLLGRQFVFAPDLARALRRARTRALRPFRFSYDMLGESACTEQDAQRYFEAYCAAVAVVGAGAARAGPSAGNDGVSVKLSALDCRCEPLQRRHTVPRLIGRLGTLARAARAANIGLTIDAEEHERLELALEVIEAVCADAQLRGWDGLGLAVQAYQRRALGLIEWAEALARRCGQRLSVRLVKGAYWDVEVQRAQQLGLAAFPVYTRKCATDASYLACARRLLRAESLYPAFATHNARTVATVLAWAGPRRDFEFQRLHGMGAGLYEGLMRDAGVCCRVYAPVGGYAELLPYLVRRILENGANAGFVYQLAHPAVDDARLLLDPVGELQRAPQLDSEAIVAPEHLFPGRINSAGIDFADAAGNRELLARLSRHWEQPQRAAPLVGGVVAEGTACPLRDPACAARLAGTVVPASAAQLQRAFALAAEAQPGWAGLGVEPRARCLERTAELLERDREALMALAVREAGKCIPDALAEVREAVDFCRYYAQEARALMPPVPLPGPTGERNELGWAARGIFACISPWNFPLAIFLGQIAAALVTGNAVLAKPAPQTPLMAFRAVRLLLEAGVPPEVIALLPGDDALGAALVGDVRLGGVVFTGSTATARRIAQSLLSEAARPLIPLIAETGGLNAMLVDSSALPERVVADVLSSAFQSAGQRCSALRLLCLQEEIAPQVLRLLIGAMDRLRLGDPAALDTDVGPVIDAAARNALESYVASLDPATVLYRCPLPAGAEQGQFVAPTLVRLAQIEDLRQEVFGPVLHVTLWRAGELERTVERINAGGYGLTLGLQTRLTRHIEQVRARARVGNLYVNRSMIGAVVGSQPFGGEGLSGTGPKAGGPHYLMRFMTERSFSLDTTATGGNVALLREAE